MLDSDFVYIWGLILFLIVYISTDYVYLGTGNHAEIDPLYPNNEYAWTKLGGECSTKLVKDHLIIRTSFGPLKFPYKEAFENLWVSKDYINVIAPKLQSMLAAKLQEMDNDDLDEAKDEEKMEEALPSAFASADTDDISQDIERAKGFALEEGDEEELEEDFDLSEILAELSKENELEEGKKEEKEEMDEAKEEEEEETEEEEEEESEEDESESEDKITDLTVDELKELVKNQK